MVGSTKCLPRKTLLFGFTPPPPAINYDRLTSPIEKVEKRNHNEVMNMMKDEIGSRQRHE
jgi:hypothetical protein